MMLSVGANDKNVGINDENVGINGKNVGINDENVGINTKEKVLSLIKENNQITIDEMASIVNKETRTVERILKTLKDENRIKRIGSKKTGHWETV